MGFASRMPGSGHPLKEADLQLAHVALRNTQLLTSGSIFGSVSRTLATNHLLHQALLIDWWRPVRQQGCIFGREDHEGFLSFSQPRCRYPDGAGLQPTANRLPYGTRGYNLQTMEASQD